MASKRFRGEEEFKVDSKGRVSIPAKFRAVLEHQDDDWSTGKPVQMTIVYGDHLKGCVECHSARSMAEVEDMLLAMNQGDRRTKAMKRWFLTQSEDFQIDETGRIVLPAKMRRKIGVEAGQPALFVGLGKTFQIWNPDTYAETVAAQEAEWLAEEGGDIDPDVLFDEVRAAQSSHDED